MEHEILYGTIVIATLALIASAVSIFISSVKMEEQNKTAKKTLDNQVIFKIFDIFTEYDFRMNRLHVYDLSKAYRRLKESDPDKDEDYYVKKTFHGNVFTREKTGEKITTPGKDICRLVKGDFGEIASMLKLNPDLTKKIIKTWGDTISLSWRALEPEIEYYRNKWDKRHFEQFKELNDEVEEWYKENKLILPPLF